MTKGLTEIYDTVRPFYEMGSAAGCFMAAKRYILLTFPE